MEVDKGEKEKRVFRRKKAEGFFFRERETITSRFLTSHPPIALASSFSSSFFRTRHIVFFKIKKIRHGVESLRPG